MDHAAEWSDTGTGADEEDLLQRFPKRKYALRSPERELGANAHRTPKDGARAFRSSTITSLKTLLPSGQEAMEITAPAFVGLS